MSIHDGELELIDWDTRIETPPPRPSETIVMEFVEEPPASSEEL